MILVFLLSLTFFIFYSFSKDEITTDSNICDGSIKSKQAFSSPPPKTPDVFKIPKATGQTFGVPSTGTSSVKRKAVLFQKG